MERRYESVWPLAWPLTQLQALLNPHMHLGGYLLEKWLLLLFKDNAVHTNTKLQVQWVHFKYVIFKIAHRWLCVTSVFLPSLVLLILTYSVSLWERFTCFIFSSLFLSRWQRFCLQESNEIWSFTNSWYC